LATTTCEPYNDIIQEIEKAQTHIALAAEVTLRIVNTQIVYILDLQRIHESPEEPSKEWKVTAGGLTYEGTVTVPMDNLVRNKVISFVHDNSESGHIAVVETSKLVSQNFPLPVVYPTVQKHIAGCKLCHQIKTRQHTHHGTHMLLPPLSRPWQ
jgi:hypothetical protein